MQPRTGPAIRNANGEQAMNIFITGASGFVGGAAARRLAAEGHRVRAMSRSSSSAQTIRAIGAEPIRCDLDTVTSADVRGAEIVIHCAAFVEQWDLWTHGITSTSRAPGVCSALPNRPALHSHRHRSPPGPRLALARRRGDRSTRLRQPLPVLPDQGGGKPCDVPTGQGGSEQV